MLIVAPISKVKVFFVLHWKKAAILAGSGMLLFVLALFLMPFPEDRLYPEQAYRYYDSEDRLIGTLISKDGFFRMHVNEEDIPKLLLDTLLLVEDQYFYQHFGINPLAIMRALRDNLLSGRVVSGGSTITMQLARMVERRERTLWAKSVEAFRAIQLEIHYTKSEILAFYLALAPYGGNIEGVQSAAFTYFGKPASMLSVGEIALLIALPRSPNHFRPDKNNMAATRIRNEILEKMHDAGFITKDQLRRALLEQLPNQRLKNDTIIPHLAWHLRLQNPDTYVWKTTIDKNIQLRTLKLVKNYVNTFYQFHITNAAAVVIDNKTRELKAAVGSADYFSVEGQGANDGTRSARSPGSTLKPFLYGLGFQAGVISEKTILYDIPINYAGYAPQNYSKRFNGTVTAREALTDSLNVVAVKLSRELGAERLYNLLKDGGISTLDKPSSYYGLPLVLGGVEIQLIELANLYSSLANRGIYQPLKLLQNQHGSSEQKQLLTPEATWLVTHILTDVERPDFPESWQFSKNRATIAWKTGTSYGQQDAWSVGYTPQYTIGVWVGNFDATPSKGLIGSEAAAPLLFDLFQALNTNNSKEWFSKPAGIDTREVCSTCGTRANPYCQSFTSEYYIKHHEAELFNQVCEIPQQIVVDKATGKQADSDTPAENRKKEIYNIWPSEVAQFLLLHGVPVREAPAYDIANMAGQKYYPPKILSPVKNTVYYRQPKKIKVEHHGIKLSAAVTNRVRKVFWFMDDTLIRETDPLNDFIINPDPGSYRITLIDDVGGSDEVKLVVENFEEKPLGNYAENAIR